MRGALALALAGCLPTPATPLHTAEPPPEDPALLSFALACDLDRDLWTLEAVADGPTGGGTAFWTRDGAYLERHPVVATTIQPDDGTHTLALNLTVTSDWRTQRAGSSTAFGCASGVSVRFQLAAPCGAVVACADHGPPLDWAAVPDVPACP